MRTLAAILLLSAVSFAQGGGGKVGFGGKAGFGGGVASGGSTVTFGSYGLLNTGPGVNFTATWNSAPSGTGKGEMMFFWHTTGTTVTSVCNGTGTDGCTGSDTFTSVGSYLNTGNFMTEIYYTCNTTTTTAITVTVSASSQVYPVAIWFSGQTTGGCLDAGPGNAQSTTATQLTTGAVTTTNAHDLLVAAFANNCGGTDYAAGVDGQGHAMVDTLAALNGVVHMFYNQESSTNTYTPTATGGPTCGVGGNAQAVAFK